MCKYTVSTESKYIKAYQNCHYRAVILDDRGRRIRCGDNWFLTEEQAAAEHVPKFYICVRAIITRTN